jgi:outer membrane protein assembly factor BamB/thioredoxin-like negative regulator of GroEL
MADEVRSVRGNRRTGEVNPKSLIKIFKNIHENRQVATLLVAKGANEKCFYFTIGAIRMVTVGPDEGLPLSNVLLRRRLISKEKLALAEKKRRSMEVPLKDSNDEDSKRMVMPLLEDVLGMEEMMPRKDLHDSVATVVRWELEDVFFWAEASYTLWMSSPPLDLYKPDMEAHKMSFGVYKMLGDLENDVLSWSQNTTRMVTGDHPVHLSPNGPNPSELSAEAQILLRAAQSPKASIHHLLRATRHIGAMPFQAIESLDTLVNMGAISVEVRKTKRKRQPTELKQEAAQIEDWLKNLLDGMTATSNLAQIYEDLGEPEKGIEFRRDIAEKFIEEGAYDNALTELQHIVDISERDFPAYERMIELLQQLKRKPELSSMSRKYAELLSFNRLFNRARRVWQFFLNMVPEDIEARRNLADAHLQVNDTEAAQQELLNIVQLVEKSGDANQIQEALTDVLKVAPENDQAIERYKDMIGFKTAIFMRRGVIAAAVIVVLISMFISFRINITSKNFLRIRDKALALADENKFEDGYEMLDSFANSQTSFFTRFIKDEADKTLRAIRQTARNHYSATFDTSIQTAKLQKSKQLPEAIATLKVLQKKLTKASETLCTRRRKRLEECTGLLSFYTTRERNAKTRMTLALKTTERGESKQAFEIYKQLVGTSVWLPGLNQAMIPLRIETNPGNAQIFNGPVAVGRSPITVEVPIGADLEITAELPGYEKTSVDPKSRWSWPIKIKLKKRKAWSVDMTGPVEANIAQVGRLVVAGDRAGELIALQAPQGQEAVKVLWTRKLGLDGDVEAIALSREALAVVLGSGKISSFDPNSGALLWTEPSSLLTPALLRTIRKGTLVIYVTADDELVATRSATGAQIWKHKYGALSRAPIIDGTQVLVSTMAGQFLFLNGRTGKVINKIHKIADEPLPNPIVTTIKNDKRYVFVMEDGKVFIASFSRSGRVALRKSSFNLPISQPALAVGERLYIAAADSDGTVLCINITTRKKIFSQKLKVNITGPPFVTEKALYLQAGNGLHALDLVTGEVLWRYNNDLPLVAPAAAGNGKLILSDSKKQLLSIFE